MNFPYRNMVVDEMGQVWRKYRIGTDSYANRKYLASWDEEGVWQQVGLGCRRRVFIHINRIYVARSIIVYQYFYGPIPKGYVVHHRDEVSNNDDPTNLELKSRSQHQIDHRKGISRIHKPHKPHKPYKSYKPQKPHRTRWVRL